MKKWMSILMAITMMACSASYISAEAPKAHDCDCCPATIIEVDENDAADPNIICITHPYTRTFSKSELEHISGDRYWCIHYNVTVCKRCNKTLSKVEYDRHEV